MTTRYLFNLALEGLILFYCVFARNFNFPDERTDTEQETTQSVNMAGTASFGLKFTEDHEIETTTLWLRNTDNRGRSPVPRTDLRLRNRLRCRCLPFAFS